MATLLSEGIDEGAGAETRICEYCNARFPFSQKKWWRRFCSRRCTHRAGESLRRAKRGMKYCSLCRKPLVGHQSLYCAGCKKHGNFLAARKRRAKNVRRETCAYCNGPMPAKGRWKFCCERCQIRGREDTPAAILRHARYRERNRARYREAWVEYWHTRGSTLRKERRTRHVD